MKSREGLKWLEKFPLRFDRNDPSSWTEDNLPAHMKFVPSALQTFPLANENPGRNLPRLLRITPKFVRDARLEIGVLSAFEKIWNTSNLLASFDGINLTLPLPSATRPNSTPWPHQDQDSRIRGFQRTQGILNVVDNGPQDGGLVVLKGSHKLNDEFFKTDSMDKKEKWGKMSDDWHGFDEDELEWFKEKRCEVV